MRSENASVVIDPCLRISLSLNRLLALLSVGILLGGCVAAPFVVPAAADVGLGAFAIYQRYQARQALDRQTEEIARLREEMRHLRADRGNRVPSMEDLRCAAALAIALGAWGPEQPQDWDRDCRVEQ